MARATAGDAGRAESFRWKWRLAIAASSLTATQRHVGHALALHMDTHGGSCYPSLALLARETGYSKRAVELAVATLDKQGWLRRDVGGGWRTSTRYFAQIPTSEAANVVRLSQRNGAKEVRIAANEVRQRGERGSPKEVIEKEKRRPPAEEKNLTERLCVRCNSAPPAHEDALICAECALGPKVAV